MEEHRRTLWYQLQVLLQQDCREIANSGIPSYKSVPLVIFLRYRCTAAVVSHRPQTPHNARSGPAVQSGTMHMVLVIYRCVYIYACSVYWSYVGI